MATRRRWLQFSLQTAFVVLTAFAIWLGVAVNRAREQREAVKAIETLGGVVFYDWQLPNPENYWELHEGGPHGPALLRRFIGDDFFQSVRAVRFPVLSRDMQANVLEAIPPLQRMIGLEAILIPVFSAEYNVGVPKSTIDALQSALPDCEVCEYGYGGGP
jgi:hypothetical protein